jgi:aspartate/methionine/tyrosine aminotransferase
VYEHLVFDGRPHIPLSTLPDMRERCLRIGSAGKIFSLTGWKVGWVAGPRKLLSVVTKAHQFITFTTPPALQLGVAHGLTNEMDFPLDLTKRLQKNRDILTAGLTKLGFEVQPCEGTYFLTAGIAKLTNEKDFAFCERLIREAGVALIPLSAFFKTGTPDTFVRFAFCKQQSLIEQSLARLEKYLGAP